MKKIIPFISFLLASLFTNAQLKQIAEGPKFAEPEEGFAKIIQMKNGNTIYIHITVLNGIIVRIYDPKHVETVVANPVPSYGELKWKGHMYGLRTETIYGMFEINNDVLIFLSTDVTPHKETVRKLIIDGATGKLKADDTVATLEDGKFMVTKDYLNEHYSTLIISEGDNKNETSANTIILFDNYHKEIRRISTEDAPVIGGKYKKSRLTQMLMINDKIFAVYTAYTNLKDYKPLASNTFITVSESGTSFSKDFVLLKLPAEMPLGGYITKYNPVTKKIYFFILKNNYDLEYKKNFRYYMYVNVFDTETKSIQSFEDVGINEQTNEAYKKRFSKKDDYLGLAQNIYINDDGSFSLFCEERTVGGVEGDIYYIGKVLQSNYDKDGKFRSAYIIPKNHNLFNQRQFTFSRAKWETTAQTLLFGSQYKSFIYLNGKENKYLLFNDVERNNDVKGDKYTTVAAVNGCDTYIYKLAGNELVPERVYAFGEPGKENKAAMLMVSDYNRETNTLATLMLNKGSEKVKTVNLIWVQPQ